MPTSSVTYEIYLRSAIMSVDGLPETFEINKCVADKWKRDFAWSVEGWLGHQYNAFFYDLHYQFVSAKLRLKENYEEEDKRVKALLSPFLFKAFGTGFSQELIMLFSEVEFSIINKVVKRMPPIRLRYNIETKQIETVKKGA